MATTEITIVATPRKNKSEETPPATIPMGSGVSYGSADHSFTLQAIMELKGSIGEMKSSFDAMRASVDGMKSKVDDLVNWKHRILGGAIVLGMVITVFAFFIGKFWDYVTIKTPSVQIQPYGSQAPPPDIPSPNKSVK